MPTPQHRIARLVAALWTKNQPQVRERLALLDRAAQALAAGALDEPTKEAAIQTAHKLAGTLGMFGHPQATEIARHLEQAYDQDAPTAQEIESLTQSLHQDLKL